jgi:hypothetical protein
MCIISSNEKPGQSIGFQVQGAGKCSYHSCAFAGFYGLADQVGGDLALVEVAQRIVSRHGFTYKDVECGSGNLTMSIRPGNGGLVVK